MDTYVRFLEFCLSKDISIDDLGHSLDDYRSICDSINENMETDDVAMYSFILNESQDPKKIIRGQIPVIWSHIIKLIIQPEYKGKKSWCRSIIRGIHEIESEKNYETYLNSIMNTDFNSIYQYSVKWAVNEVSKQKSITVDKAIQIVPPTDMFFKTDFFMNHMKISEFILAQMENQDTDSIDNVKRMIYERLNVEL